MIMAMRAIGMTAMCVSLALPMAACRSFLPRDETPVTPQPLAAAPGVASSGQKLDAQGYPIVGRMPRAARPQASDETVKQTQQRHAHVEARGRANPEAAYRRDVAELEALAARQQAEADRVLAPATAPADAASSRAQ